jgi:hypothetical protein
MNAPSFPVTANSPTNRTHYKSSGAVNLAAFLPLAFLALAVAGALAGVMFWLYHEGQYYIVIVPILCALTVAGMARLAVAKGHCRNSFVAGLTGLLLGLALFFGSYYIGLVYHLGAKAATRPDLLVRYIRFRLATDVQRDVHTPYNENGRPGRRSGTQGMNWFTFAFESIAVLVIVTVAPYRRARKPYCERCKRWLVRETTVFEPHKCAGLIDSLQAGSPRALAALCAAPAYTSIPNTTMAVEYCPSLKEATSRECPVFISLKNISANPKGATLDSFEQSKGKVVERCVQLNPDELPALAPRFPVFEAYAGRAAVAALLPTEEPAETGAESKDAGELAVITPLGAHHHNKVLTRGTIWKGNIFAFAGLFSFLGGFGIVAWGGFILDKAASGSAAQIAGIALCSLGGLMVLTVLVAMFVDTSFGGNRMLRNAFRRELARRSGLFVEPNDPDAVFIEIVPKLNWGKVMLDNASDIGLFVVDKMRKELRFEGDKERWRIPAGSITGCQIEYFVHGQGAGAQKLYYLVLRATRKEGFWEAPIRERRGSGLLSSKRKKAAKQLAVKIQEILPAQLLQPL